MATPADNANPPPETSAPPAADGGLAGARASGRRILGVFDPTRGFWIILLGLPVTFGLAVGLVMLGLKYGAIGFYGGVGLILSIGTYVLEKRYGRHLQVDDFPLARRIITIIPAFLALAGLFMLMFYLAGKL